MPMKLGTNPEIRRPRPPNTRLHYAEKYLTRGSMDENKRLTADHHMRSTSGRISYRVGNKVDDCQDHSDEIGSRCLRLCL